MDNPSQSHPISDGLVAATSDAEPSAAFDALSMDAKVIAGTLFGAKTAVTFHMRESKPTARAQAALDELLVADIIRATHEYHNRQAVTYRPTRPLISAFQWVAARMDEGLGDSMNFPIMELIR